MSGVFRDAGPAAPLVVEYHACELPRPDAEASIVCDGQPPGGGHYRHFREPGGALGIIRSSDWPEHSRLVLAGFSEGCQGVRTQLADGAVPDAVLAIDGIHADNDMPPWQVDPWADLLARAKRGDTLFVHTSTLVPTFGQYKSTRDMVRVLWGGDIEQKTSPAELGGVTCEVYREGLALLYLFPGGSAASHIEQGRVVLPAAMGLALSALSGGDVPEQGLPGRASSGMAPAWKKIAAGAGTALLALVLAMRWEKRQWPF